jgi:hypothetical protein
VPFVKVWIHFVDEESLFSEVFRLKPKYRGNSSPLAEASGNMGKQGQYRGQKRYGLGGNMGCSGDKRQHGCGDKCWPDPESKSGYVH